MSLLFWTYRTSKAARAASLFPAEEKAPRRLADEFQTVIGAGLVTTAWALTVAIYYLQVNPPILEKLRAELFAAVPDLSGPDALAYQKLESLPYLRGCVREGIRLSHGVSCRMPRLIDTPVAYGDWIIPPGTPTSMTILDVQFNETLYPKPYDFVPERWIGNPKALDGESMEKYWVAFGKGPRNCLGIKYVHPISFSATIWLPLTLGPPYCYLKQQPFLTLNFIAWHIWKQLSLLRGSSGDFGVNYTRQIFRTYC